jgi:hypothetical protein
VYVRIIDDLPIHPKIRHLSHEAFRLYISAICWSNLHRTRGHIPADDAFNVAGICGITEQRILAEPVITELVASGCWVPADAGGWQISVDPNGDADFWDIVSDQP